MAVSGETGSGPLQLHVEVLKANQVLAKDPNGKSDPYCLLYLSTSDHTQRTEVKHATLNPVWEESFVVSGKELMPFVVSSEGSAEFQLFGYLVIDVWDYDTVNPDDFLGRVMLPLREIPPGSPLEEWYPLTRKSAKDSIRGSLRIRVEYDVLEPGKTIDHSRLNSELYRVCKQRDFHLPLQSGKSLVELPGRTERIEMAFSHVLIDVSSYHCSAQVYLTNYRVIIVCADEHRTGRGGYQGHGSALDLSMWIALNNIMTVEMGSEAFVVSRRKSGQKQKTKTVSLSLKCYDFRSVKMIFLVDDDSLRSHSRSPEPAVCSAGNIQDSDSSTAVGGTERGLGSKILNLASDSPTIGRKIIRTFSDKMSNIGSKNEKLKARFSSLTSRIKPPHHPHHPHPSSRTRSTAITEEPEIIQSLSFEQSSEATRHDNHKETDGKKISPDSLNSASSSDIEDSYEMIHDGDLLVVFDEYEIFSIHKSDEVDGASGEGGVVLAPPPATSMRVKAFFFRLEHIVLNVADFPPAQTFVKSFDGYLELSGWDLYNFPKEMDRQGVDMSGRWELSVANGPQYELCSTYPQLLYIPKGTYKGMLQESAKFRSKNRLPCLVWMNPHAKNFMMRCAQPLTGASGKHSQGDEDLMLRALAAGPEQSHMTIYDARTFSAAAGNKIMGKGTEDISRYAQSKLTYLDIPNIHAVRESYDALQTACLSSVSEKWYSTLENTQWLSYVSLILKGAKMIARYMTLQRGCCLVHCSDGWDRTSQLTSLAQIMMDAYYRTQEGFMILVDKEWLSFGHKFQHRLGHPSHPAERSPIFLQFLDCVHQILRQFPKAFEFNVSYLLCLAEHLNTAWFGTFLCNCDKERYDLSLYARSPSLWGHMTAESKRFKNHDYIHTTDALFPTSNIRRLRLWEEYFLRFDCTALAQQGREQEVELACQNEETLVRASRDHRDMQESWSADTVLWMSDEGTTECCYCQSKFSPFKRKHHCRACGRIFCNDCSKHKIALSHLGYFAPVRVCDECHTKLNGAQRTQDGEDGYLVVHND